MKRWQGRFAETPCIANWRLIPRQLLQRFDHLNPAVPAAVAICLRLADAHRIIVAGFAKSRQYPRPALVMLGLSALLRPPNPDVVYQALRHGIALWHRRVCWRNWRVCWRDWRVRRWDGRVRGRDWRVRWRHWRVCWRDWSIRRRDWSIRRRNWRICWRRLQLRQRIDHRLPAAAAVGIAHVLRLLQRHRRFAAVPAQCRQRPLPAFLMLCAMILLRIDY